MRKRRERVWFISKHLCFPCFENINVLEALAKQRCVPIGKQNVYQWSASLLERSMNTGRKLERDKRFHGSAAASPSETLFLFKR